MTNKSFLSYEDAGVHIDSSNMLIKNIKVALKKNTRPEVIGELGGFSALCSLPKKYSEPILVLTTDGLGTKLQLAIELKRHNTIGIDLVAMSVNDLIVQGAEPLFFLDYYATGRLDIEIATCVIKGIITGCKQSGCSLVGGETAEMPGMYHSKDYDIVGFCVGVVEKDKIIDGSKVKPGDSIIALASSGLHSNGFSLIRKILKLKEIDLRKTYLENKLLVDYLLEPTRIYVKNILTLMEKIDIHAIVHVTGGGFFENIPRILPVNTQAQIDRTTWEWPPIFHWLQEMGNIRTHEMYRTFNCGVGMLIIIAREKLFSTLEFLRQLGENAWNIGKIVEIEKNERNVVIIK